MAIQSHRQYHFNCWHGVDFLHKIKLLLCVGLCRGQLIADTPAQFCQCSYPSPSFSLPYHQYLLELLCAHPLLRKGKTALMGNQLCHSDSIWKLFKFFNRLVIYIIPSIRVNTFNECHLGCIPVYQDLILTLRKMDGRVSVEKLEQDGCCEC